MDLNCEERHFDRHPKHDISPEDGANINECEPAYLEILDRVKISNTFDTPMSTIKGVFKDAREKDLSYKKQELKEVEERLKAAFVEFYQKLCHLKHYR